MGFFRVSGLMLSFTLVSARLAVRLLDLAPRGTVFVLLKALEIKEIDLDEYPEVFDQLTSQGFRLKEEVYVEL